MKSISMILLLLAATTSAFSQSAVPRSVYLTDDEAGNIIGAFSGTLPPDIPKEPGAARKAAWNAWVKQSDQAIRSRLAQGDEDSLVNFLLFGSSFTKLPRITLVQLGKPDESLIAALQARLGDFVLALEKPSGNERLVFARQVLLGKHGYKTTTEVERNKLKVFLLNSVRRVLLENDKYNQIVEAARRQDDPSSEFAERSKLYSTRGLSSDTVTQPNFAIEEALKGLKSKGMMAAGRVKRIAIIGPGLDFTDKQEGFDFYPLQTIQPFAVFDSLVKLGLSDAKNLNVTTMDISPRINFHLRTARSNATAGKSYSINLSKDNKVEWNRDFLEFWSALGKRIGLESRSPKSVDYADVKLINVSPATVSRVSAADLNIVLQRLQLPPNERFDLIIATNILVYYNSFEQSLAMLNIEKMLNPGGIFLSNNVLLELKSSKMLSVGHTAVTYSTRKDDGDIIVWYQKSN